MARPGRARPRTPPGPRETLLARAIPDAADLDASLRALAAGREVAARFCREWSEIERSAEETAWYAALRQDLVKAGRAALPYLATLLAVPPQAVFANEDESRGPTARQQVRALWALSFLETQCFLPLVLFHTRGRSWTQCATARAVLQRVANLEWAEDADEATQLRVIDAWWASHVAPGSDGPPDGERDHLIRHVLRWTRDALASDDPETVARATWGPRQLQLVIGRIAFDPDAPRELRAAQVAALERDAMRMCPTARGPSCPASSRSRPGGR